jgi:hypothetical protein
MRLIPLLRCGEDGLMSKDIQMDIWLYCAFAICFIVTAFNTIYILHSPYHDECISSHIEEIRVHASTFDKIGVGGIHYIYNNYNENKTVCDKYALVRTANEDEK